MVNATVNFTLFNVLMANDRLSRRSRSGFFIAADCVRALEANPFDREALINLFVVQCYCNDEEFTGIKESYLTKKLESMQGKEMDYRVLVEIGGSFDGTETRVYIEDIRVFDGTVQVVNKKYNYKTCEYEVWNETESRDGLYYAWNKCVTQETDYHRVRELTFSIVRDKYLSADEGTRELIYNALKVFNDPSEESYKWELYDAVQAMNALAPKAYVEGKKLSRVFLAFCKALEVADEAPRSKFQRLYAQISDELNASKNRR